ncbi:hypothetical protein BTJ40_05575 [Microbulbifer sp. A4B17]|uniref:hypothetical protein n=1 Tax=Microbulbifer sp. A4B17 TaxID=359370 RepID=UPI000D52E46E|nr:hypothetical protein [Microbulbifer sp. A4B17]AWF80322.1 hypothetical protein BTJ40_05575 [Microbulbifer sp. A4B17]
MLAMDGLRKKILWGCMGFLVIIGVALGGSPFFLSWFPNSVADRGYFLYIDLDDIEEDAMISVDWSWYRLLIVKPRREVLEQLDVLVEPKKHGKQPPKAQDRLDHEIKVFMLQVGSEDGVPRLAERDYYRSIIPCYEFKYLPGGVSVEGHDLAGALQCVESEWDSWENYMIFDLNGRSQSWYIANLNVPSYSIEDDTLINK